MSHQPGRHLVGATEAIGLRPGVGPGAAPGSHQGLCRRTGILVDLAFACFARASRGQRAIQTPLCWPLTLVPHKLSLDVGARRVGRGRRLLQERTLVFGSGVRVGTSLPPARRGGSAGQAPPELSGVSLVVPQAAGAEAPHIPGGRSLPRLRKRLKETVLRPRLSWLPCRAPRTYQSTVTKVVTATPPPRCIAPCGRGCGAGGHTCRSPSLHPAVLVLRFFPAEVGSSECCLLGCLVRARLRKWISGQPRQEDCAPWGGTWPASLAVQPSHSAGWGARGGSRERRVTVGVWMRELLKVASQSIKRQGPHVGAGLRAAWHASPGGGGEGATHPRPGCTHTHLLSFPPRTETWGPQGGGDEARPEMVPDRWRSCPMGWDGGLPGRGAGTWTLAAGVDQEEQRSAGDPGRATGPHEPRRPHL